MRKSIPLVIIFLILLLLLELGYTLFKVEHVEEYVVDGYNIVETYKDHSYYLAIDKDNTYYRYQTDINYNKTTNIVEKVLTYNVNNFKCIYPVFKENSVIRDEKKYNDIECYYNGTTYTGESLNGMLDLSPFKKTIKDSGYSYNTWENKENNTKGVSDGTIYTLDLFGVYLTMVNDDNSHFYVSNKTIGYTEDFTIDISNINDIGLAGNYFIYPSSTGQITNFSYIDITTGTEGSVNSIYKISTNSYANGSYNNELYIYDLNAHKQYKVNKNRVAEVTEKNNTSLYYDGEKTEFLENSKFDNKLYFNTSTGRNVSYYVKNNYLYKVYNGDNDHPVIIYRNGAKGIKASKGYIMFSTDRDVYVYSDTTGIELYYHSLKGSVSENKYNIYVR